MAYTPYNSAIPGADIYATADVMATNAYNKALAQINNQRSSLQSTLVSTHKIRAAVSVNDTGEGCVKAYIACQQEGCDNYGAPYFLEEEANEEANEREEYPCPLCGVTMQEIPTPDGADTDG